MNYVPIGFKTDYSLLKSLLKVKDIVDYAKNLGASYLGVLDDNMFGIMDFYDKCIKNDLKCVFGQVIKIGETKFYLYIKDYNGYLNLITINDLIDDKKFTLDQLFKYNDGLIVVLPYENYNLYNRLKTTFDVYLGYKNETELKNALLINKKVLFINEIKAFKKSELNLLSILYKIGSIEFKDNDYYILEASDFDRKTVEDFVENISLKFDFNKRYIPLFTKDASESKKYLSSLAINGLKKRLDNKVPKMYIERLKHELSVIESMGFVDYFLIVYDYVKYAKKQNIMANPRGSAAGSLVSYTLGISDVDPLKYELLFERFLNPARVTMPDIDMDFEDTRRQDIIEYVRKKYGEKNVSLIVAYSTMASKQVIRDVGKVLGIKQEVIDALSKLLTAKGSLKDNAKIDEVIKFVKDNKLETYYKICIRLEGLKKNTTVHAAGVVISSVALSSIIPTMKTSDGLLTGFTMEYLENLGLLKMDFLALRNLTIMHNVLNLINKQDKNFELKNIPFNDSKTFEVFKRGDTDNIFQFESIGMKRFLKKLNPNTLDDLIAANALFRPGPMQNIDEYIARKNGEHKITYPHMDLEPILKSTYGIIIYQEQIMQILSKMGGYSFAEADLVRRAMSKKKLDVMEKEKIRFVSGAVKRGYTEECAKEVYELIIKFANYGFNKSHSVVYAIMGYRMAYLKAHYRDLFSVNNLNMNSSSKSSIKEIIDDAKNRGMEIIKPDINKSSYQYVVNDNRLILPLNCIKDISTNISKVIVDNAPYSDIFDFFIKCYGQFITRQIVERLIKSGAFDCFGYKKITLIDNLDSLITYYDLCKSLDESLVEKPEIIESSSEDLEVNDLDTFGFYIMNHPTSSISGVIKIKDLSKHKNRIVNIGVIVDKIKVINTKKGEKMAFLNLSDDTGSINGVVFPKNNVILNDISEGIIAKLKVNVTERNDEIQAILEEIIK